MKKIRDEPFKGRVLFQTTYSEYFKHNVHMFDALDFLAELTPDAWASNTTNQRGAEMKVVAIIEDPDRLN